MPIEECGACGATVSLSEAVHATIHTKTDEGVVDHYVCRDCYEEHLAAPFG